MAKLPQIITGLQIKIEKLVPGGQGIGAAIEASSVELEGFVGKKGFFWNVLPGEIVTKFEITKNKSKYFEAIALEVENHSAHRILPKDNVYLSTSPWQMMDYDLELAQKSELLGEIFRQAGLDSRLFETSTANNGARMLPVLTDNYDFCYRNKMEYALYWDNETERIRLAFHARGSHRKVPVEKSSIERPEIFEAAQKIVADLNSRHEEARKYQSLLLRANQKGEISGGLFENGKPHPKFMNLTDEILGEEYSYSPNGFFQINLPVYEMALQEIKKYIQTEKVLDLYAGVGTIGLSVARDKKLTLVENNKSAYKELLENCKALQEKSPLSSINATPMLANSEDALDYIEQEQTVIVDPPRAGCDKRLIERLLKVRPRTVIYLSCNPTTQARDLKILTEAYEIVGIIPYNFFPRTPHLENLVILRV